MNYSLTEEEWECVRVCVSNAPIPYDITKKKIPANILQKIGQPIKSNEQGVEKVEYDLTPYGIKTEEWEKDLELCALEMDLTLRILLELVKTMRLC